MIQYCLLLTGAGWRILLARWSWFSMTSQILYPKAHLNSQSTARNENSIACVAKIALWVLAYIKITIENFRRMAH